VIAPAIHVYFNVNIKQSTTVFLFPLTKTQSICSVISFPITTSAQFSYLATKVIENNSLTSSTRRYLNRTRITMAEINSVPSLRMIVSHDCFATLNKQEIYKLRRTFVSRIFVILPNGSTSLTRIAQNFQCSRLVFPRRSRSENKFTPRIGPLTMKNNKICAYRYYSLILFQLSFAVQLVGQFIRKTRGNCSLNATKIFHNCRRKDK